MSSIEAKGSKLTKKTKQPEERLGSGDILMLSIVLPHLPTRDTLLKMVQGENINILPRQIGKEKWEIELKKSFTGGQEALFILMHTTDDIGQETTYGIITDPNIQEITSRVIGARNNPIINFYGKPINFADTTRALRELMFGEKEPRTSPRAKSLSKTTS